jgi:hypothetical protein
MPRRVVEYGRDRKRERMRGERATNRRKMSNSISPKLEIAPCPMKS